MLFEKLHHVAIIVSDYQRAREFYVEKLGFTIIKKKVYKTNKHVFLEPAGRKGIC